jgi:imidazolonepropionase-like amidohydrolase
MSKIKSRSCKAVKYGDISEEDAWKFVTLNPAKLCI